MTDNISTTKSRLVYGVIATVFFVPLFNTHWTLLSALFGKWMIVYGILFLLTLFLVRILIVGRTLFIPRHPLLIALALFIVVRIIAGIWGEDPFKSFWGDALRLTGTWVWILLFIAASALSVWAGTTSRRLFVLWMATLSASVVAFFGWLVQYAPATFNVNVGTIGNEGRFIGLQGNATYFAVSVMVGVFMAAALVSLEYSRVRRMVAIGLLIGLTITLFYAKTRATIIGMLFGFAVAGVIFLWHHRVRYYRYIAVGVVVVGVLFLSVRVLAPSVSFQSFSLSNTVQTILKSSGAPTRFYFWNAAWKGFLEKPMLGWGPENYEFIFDKYYPPQLLQFSLYETWAERPHNIFLEHLAGVGIIGFIIFISIFLVVLRTVFKIFEPKERLTASFLAGLWMGYGAYAVFTFDTPANLLYVFTAAGLLASYAPNVREVRIKLPLVIKMLALFVWFCVGIYSIVVLFVLPLVESRNAEKFQEYLYTNQNSERTKEALALAFSGTSIFRNDTIKILADDFINENTALLKRNPKVSELIPLYLVEIENALKQTPRNFGLQLREAQLLSLAAQTIDKTTYYERAWAAFARGRELSPNRQVVELGEADFLLTFNDIPALENLIQRLEKNNDNASLTSWLLSLLLSAKGDESDAGKAIARALDLGFRVPPVQETLDFAVHVLEKNNDYSHIVALIKSAVSENTDRKSLASGINYLRLAYALGNIARYDDARAAASRAVELDPSLETPVAAFLAQLELARQGKRPN